jgi:transglutaminase-like putative cysteine protease
MKSLKIVHRTYYNFSGEVLLGPHRLLLRPRTGHELLITSSSLELSPAATVRWQRDVHDNSVAIATFSTRATQLAILSEVVVQQYDDAPLDFIVADNAVHYPFAYDVADHAALQPFLRCATQPHNSGLDQWIARMAWQPGQAIQSYTLLERLCTAIHGTFAYRGREQPGVQSVAETLGLASGSCRDFAHLYVQAARSLGFAARFVSGYLHAPPSIYDLGATHAWAEVYLPGAGWKGFDPTLGTVVGNEHIAVAVASQSDAVSPVSGSFVGPSGASLHVGVWVTAL